MNENPDAEARLVDHVVQLLRGHARLLADKRRNAAFFAALCQEVTPKSHVVDIGTGTGLWAIAAAKLGAQKVVAIERDPLLLGMIQALAAENNVADRLQVIAGDSRQVQLPAAFDLVISETIGNVGFDEEIWPVLTDARHRFLKPGGKLIPSAMALRVAPACFDNPEDDLPAGVPLTYTAFESLYLNIPAGCPQREQLRLVGPSVDLIRVDFTTATEPPSFKELTASWAMEDLHQVNCMVIWPESVLTQGVHLNAMDTSSWSPVVYRIRPVTAARGELQFRLSLTSKSNDWSVTARWDQGEQERCYSPGLATSALMGQMRLGANRP